MFLEGLSTLEIVLIILVIVLFIRKTQTHHKTYDFPDCLVIPH